MKFLVDANLPEQLALWISEQGHDCIHTLNLEKENDTDDEEIIKFLILDPRILISKDSDFFKSYLIRKKPEKLLFITTGNILNTELIALFQLNFFTIISYFQTNNVIPRFLISLTLE